MPAALGWLTLPHPHLPAWINMFTATFSILGGHAYTARVREGTSPLLNTAACLPPANLLLHSYNLSHAALFYILSVPCIPSCVPRHTTALFFLPPYSRLVPYYSATQAATLPSLLYAKQPSLTIDLPSC